MWKFKSIDSLKKIAAGKYAADKDNGNNHLNYAIVEIKNFISNCTSEKLLSISDVSILASAFLIKLLNQSNILISENGADYFYEIDDQMNIYDILKYAKKSASLTQAYIKVSTVEESMPTTNACNQQWVLEFNYSRSTESIFIHYNKDSFDENSIRSISQYFLGFCEKAFSIPEQSLSKIALFEPEEHKIEFEEMKKYGFFTPRKVIQELPKEFSKWDKHINLLPFHVKNNNVSKILNELPVLNPENLSTIELERASIILGYFAHAYYYENSVVHNNKNDIILPENVKNSWKMVSEKLDRPGCALTIYDAVLNNWKFKNTLDITNGLIAPEMVTINHIEPIVSAFDHPAEKIFHLTIALMEIKAVSLIRNICKILNAVLIKNDIEIEQCLSNMIINIEQIKEAFQNINLNPSSMTYVDPLFWCNAIAKFTESTHKQEPGMSGLGSPLFHLLDYFTCRNRYDSTLGKLTSVYFSWLKPEHRKFIQAVTKENIIDSLINSSNQGIKDRFNQVVYSYAGENGLLHAHQVKALGFLKLMKLTSRVQTNGNLVLSSQEELKDIENKFEESRKERFSSFDNSSSYQRAEKSILYKNSKNNAYFSIIKLKMPKKISYLRSGFLCEVSPNNLESSVVKTLKELNIGLENQVKVCQKWIQYFHDREIKHSELMPVKTFFKYVDLTAIPKENILSPKGIDSKRLVPLNPRLYSIISAESDYHNNFSIITLLIKPVLNGVGSNTLLRTDSNFVLAKITPSKSLQFHSMIVPTLLIAGGTGIATFIAYLNKNTQMKNMISLIISVREMSEFKAYTKILEENADIKGLDVHMIVTRENKLFRSHFSETHYNEIGGDVGKIHGYLRLNDIQKIVINHIKLSDYRAGNGNIYISGSHTFSCAVNNAIKDIIQKNLFKSEAKNVANEYYNTLIADKKIQISASEDYFSMNRMHDNAIPVSELVLHNNNKFGHWVAIDCKVYNITNFINHHPGGDKTLVAISGTDITQEYQSIHGMDQEASALLKSYYIGDLFESSVKDKFITKLLFMATRAENELRLITSYHSKALRISRIASIQNIIRSTIEKLLEISVLKSESSVSEMEITKIIQFNEFINTASEKIMHDQRIVSLFLHLYQDLLMFIKNALAKLAELHNPDDGLQDLIKTFESQLLIKMNFAKQIMSKVNEIAIIGGGLSGLVLGIFLRKLDFQVNIYEKSADPRMQTTYYQPASFNITLSKRGLCVLDKINLTNEVKKMSMAVFGRCIHVSETMQDQLYGAENEALYSIKRSDLLTILVNAAEESGVSLYFNHECLGVDLNQELVDLTIKNKEIDEIQKIKANHIFGADGANSKVRDAIEKQRGEASTAINTHHMLYREIYLPANSKKKEILNNQRLHIWPRDNHVLIGFPNKDGSFSMSLFVDKEHDSLQKLKSDSIYFTTFLEECCPEITKYLNPLILTENYRKWGEMKHVACKVWHYQDKALLIGDAAHAFYPFYGQAGNCAFEDCYSIYSNFIKERNWKTVFTRFQTRKIETDHIAELAASHTKTLASEVCHRDFNLRSLIEIEITRQRSNLRSLYSNISFTTLSYREATDAAKQHNKIFKLVLTIFQNCLQKENFKDVSICEIVKYVIQHSEKNTEYTLLSNDDFIARAHQEMECHRLHRRVFSEVNAHTLTKFGLFKTGDQNEKNNQNKNETSAKPVEIHTQQFTNNR